jgi:hypothetical protein
MPLVDSGALVLDVSLPAHTGRILAMKGKYSDLPMEFADAWLVVMTAWFSDCQMVTLDRADSCTYRRHGRAVIPARFPDQGQGWFRRTSIGGS